MQDLKAVVASMYEAFGRGDVPAIAAKCAPEVRWEDWSDHSGQKAGLDWMQPRRGREGVAEFFKVLSTYQFNEFRVLSIMGNDTQVAAEIVVDITLPNGKRFRDEELHLFTFNPQGQVVRFRHYVDTAKAIAATNG